MFVLTIELWLGTVRTYSLREVTALMKATSDFLPDEELQRGSGLYKIWSAKGWGKGRWFLIRRSDRHVMTSGDLSHCLHRKRTLTST
jgi:hypothetical protein